MSNSQLSIQLFTVRAQLAQDPQGTLRRLAEIGFSQVEPFNLGPDSSALVAQLEELGLRAPSAHSNFISKGADGGQVTEDKLRPYFEAAATAGVQTLVEPKISAERFATATAIEQVAEELNAAARIAAEFGIALGYHNHWWEAEHSVGDISAIEYLATQLDPSIVFELDTYWVEVGGREAAALLRSLGERVALVHIKDGDRSRDTSKQQPAGEGAIAVLDILEAAPDALKVVEFDAFDGDIFDAVQRSVSFLVSNGVAL